MTRSAPVAVLSPSQLAVLRELLEQQRRFRLDQLDELHAEAERSVLTGTDKEISDSLIEGARAALRDVLDALQRMADGRYGRCRRCSATLPVERLEVLPQVSLCMACQRGDETR